MTEPLTPTLDKRHLVVEDSNKIGAFLDWLSEQGIHLARWGHEIYEDPIFRDDLPVAERGEFEAHPIRTDDYATSRQAEDEWHKRRNKWLGEIVGYRPPREGTEDRLIPIHEGFDNLLHRYFDIDPLAEERELQAVLDYARRKP